MQNWCRKWHHMRNKYIQALKTLLKMTLPKLLKKIKELYLKIKLLCSVPSLPSNHKENQYIPSRIKYAEQKQCNSISYFMWLLLFETMFSPCSFPPPKKYPIRSSYNSQQLIQTVPHPTEQNLFSSVYSYAETGILRGENRCPHV